MLVEQLLAEPVAEELIAQLPAELGEDLVAAGLVVEELVPAQPSAELLAQLPAHHCRPTRRFLPKSLALAYGTLIQDLR